MAPILDRWGYLALAGVIGVESFGVPAPGQTLMIAAAIYSTWGRLDIFAVAAVCFIAAVLGDNIGYWIGVRGGRKAVNRFGKYIFITPPRLERAERFFARRGNRIVVVARFIDGLRQLNGVIAGLTNMPWRTFLLYNTIGAALWVGWWTTVAYLFGTQLVKMVEESHQYTFWVIGGIAVAIAAYVVIHVRRRRAREADPTLDEEAAA
ncbi:DedA family protein [Actinoplanes sp. NPDC051859]|uniref:DedA family protein n=1 Tax=Actinoplanes sp. NPDC051859 TaxID=3363909 RepID=UPI0037AB9791